MRLRMLGLGAAVATLLSGAATEAHHGWDFFVTGGYGGVDTETVLPTTGFQSDVWSGTVGAEFQFSKHLTAGGAFTYLAGYAAHG